MGGRVFIGRVVSNRMQKTVVVAVNYVVWVPKYKVYRRRISRHMAHDAAQSCIVGDIVRIEASRKMSKHKHYMVKDIIKRTPVYNSAAAGALALERDRSWPTSYLAVAEERLTQAGLRLQELRNRYLGSTSITGSVFEAPDSKKVADSAASSTSSTNTSTSTSSTSGINTSDNRSSSNSSSSGQQEQQHI